MSDFPATVLDTPFGELYVWTTGADHVGIRTEAPREFPPHRCAETIQVNRVAYTLRMDIHTESYLDSSSVARYARWSKDGWGLVYQDVSLNRVDSYDKGTPAAIEKVATTLLATLVAFLQTENGQDFLAQGQQHRDEALLRRLTAEVRELEAKRDEVLARLDEMTNGDPARQLTFLDTTVTVTTSAGTDGAVVVFVDTPYEPDASDGGPGLRVTVNDEPVYEGKAYGHTDDAEEGDPAWFVRKRAELAGLEQAFALAGGRGVDLAEAIDALSTELAEAESAILLDYAHDNGLEREQVFIDDNGEPAFLNANPTGA